MGSEMTDRVLLWWVKLNVGRSVTCCGLLGFVRLLEAVEHLFDILAILKECVPAFLCDSQECSGDFFDEILANIDIAGGFELAQV